jgi:cytochrome c553
MKRYMMFVAVLAIASTLAWSAEDGAAIYKAKCAMCHGAGGEGKVGPALKGTKLSASDISGLLTAGACLTANRSVDSLRIRRRLSPATSKP